MEKYRTVGKFCEAEFVEKRSRFLSAVMPVTCEKEALDFLAQRRSQFWDATHNVYAYSLREGNDRRYSDDAEPQGTAGLPTLDVLQKSEVTDVCVVTTRYFGGVLLGTGGLVRAYSHAAKLALETAGILTMAPVTRCRISCEYVWYGKLDALLASFDAIQRENDFADRVTLSFALRTERVGALQTAVTDATGGRVQMEIGDEFVAPLEKE